MKVRTNLPLRATQMPVRPSLGAALENKADITDITKESERTRVALTPVPGNYQPHRMPCARDEARLTKG